MTKKAWLAWSFAVLSPAAALFGWITYSAVVISHDKSVNSEVGILWESSDRVPLGTVVPANNRWIEHAFIADSANGKHLVRRRALILDDHYLSSDPTLRTDTGVIGDAISREVLCSIPAQAKARGVKLDSAVQMLVDRECNRKDSA